MEQLYTTIDRIIGAQKKARQKNDFLTIMMNAEALLEYMPGLINYSVDQESAYRKFEAKLANEYSGDKKNSSAFCDTQAKATEFYKEWQKAKMFQELMYEMVQMSKKLAGSIDSELKAN